MKNRKKRRKFGRKMKEFLHLSRTDVFYIFKMCILLIFLLCFYGLKVVILPENALEFHLAQFQMNEIIESVIASVFILFGSMALFYKVFWFFVQFVTWIFILFENIHCFLWDFFVKSFLKIFKILHLIFDNCGNFDIIFGVFHGFRVWKSG